MPEDHPTRLRARRERTLFRLLHRLVRLHATAMLARIHAAGFEDVLPSYPTLLSNLDTEGTRLVVLAARAGVTRQAAGQLCTEIEAKGYVKRYDDPDDKRGVVVRFTPKGRRLLTAAMSAVQEIESAYEREVGPDHFAALKDTLSELLAELDPSGRLGA